MQNTNMDDKKRLIIAEKARRRLLSYAIAVNPRYRASWHHRVIAEKLEAVERGEIKRLIIAVPPRHGKSEEASVIFPSWYKGRNPGKNVISASYGSELAVDFGAKCRDIVSSPEFRDIFPNVRLSDNTSAKDNWVTELVKGEAVEEKGAYFGVGVGGALTGRGADLLIIDDPIKNRKEAESETTRKAIWDWYISTAYTRLEKNGAIIIIATRWRMDDLTGRVLALGEDEWDIVEFPAIAEKDEEFRKKGEALWPEKYDLAALQQIRKTLGPYEFSSLYQQKPISAENQEFKQEYFRYYEEEDIKGKNLVYMTTVDLAIGKNQENDQTAIVTVGKERDTPNWYIVDIVTGRLDPLQTIDAIFAVYQRYRPIKVGIETVAYQKSLLYFITEEMKRRQIYIPLVELKAAGEKEMRIRGLHPMYKTGVIFHRPNVQEELENELLFFPKASHDDIADALAYHIQLQNPTGDRMDNDDDLTRYFDPYRLTG